MPVVVPYHFNSKCIPYQFSFHVVIFSPKRKRASFFATGYYYRKYSTDLRRLSGTTPTCLPTTSFHLSGVSRTGTGAPVLCPRKWHPQWPTPLGAPEIPNPPKDRAIGETSSACKKKRGRAIAQRVLACLLVVVVLLTSGRWLECLGLAP